jgi:tetratricopeptide (TPR) repeat protein
MLARLKRIDKARAELENLRRQFPPLASRFDAIEGEILLGAGEPAKALAIFDTALVNHPEDPDLLFGRSLVHDKLGHTELAETDLRQLLVLNKDDARALNALGYLLTLNTTRLEEARELLTRALALDPEDGAIIDSMGWLQFRLGNLEEARRLLQKAYAIAPDAEVAAHLGEVLWNLGEKDQARSVWQAAQKEAPDHEVLRDTVNRLNR